MPVIPTFVRALLPIYNVGQAIFSGTVALILVAFGIFEDGRLAAHLAVAIYLCTILSYALLGLIPIRRSIDNRYRSSVCRILDSAPLLIRIEENVWVIERYRSWLWSSDRIYIEEGPNNTFILGARVRDMNMILEDIGLR